MAQQDAVVTEDDLEQAFKDDPQFGLEVLDSYFREPLWRYMKSISRSLTPDDMEDIYQSTIVELIRAVRRPNFDPIRPMRLVNKVIQERTVDFLRRKRIRRCQNLDDIVAFVAEDLRNSNTGFRWNLLLADDKVAFRKALDQAIDTLPPKQKSTAVAFVEVYDQIREQGSYKPLADRIKQMTGESVTAMQAKSNWHDSRSKLEEKLARAGFRSLVEG